MALVVSDTSPVRAIDHLGLLHLLSDLYSEILIPPAVDEELKTPPSRLPSVDVGRFAFIRVQAPTDREQVVRLREALDPGESEALALALEVHADLVLIDEAEGRTVARRLGLVPVGVLGTLARAKQRGLIPTIEPLIDRLQGELRFLISPKLRSDVLRSVGESP